MGVFDLLKQTFQNMPAWSSRASQAEDMLVVARVGAPPWFPMALSISSPVPLSPVARYLNASLPPLTRVSVAGQLPKVERRPANKGR